MLGSSSSSSSDDGNIRSRRAVSTPPRMVPESILDSILASEAAEPTEALQSDRATRNGTSSQKEHKAGTLPGMVRSILDSIVTSETETDQAISDRATHRTRSKTASPQHQSSPAQKRHVEPALPLKTSSPHHQSSPAQKRRVEFPLSSATASAAVYSDLSTSDIESSDTDSDSATLPTRTGWYNSLNGKDRQATLNTVRRWMHDDPAPRQVM